MNAHDARMIETRYNLRAELADDESIGEADRMVAQGWLAGAEYVLQRMGVNFSFDNDGLIVIEG